MGRLRYWLATHPRIARTLRVLGWLEFLSIFALTAAPSAVASTNAAALNWTGLQDNYGVPPGDYYLSLASLHDRITDGGPQGSGWNPSTWGPWMLHGVKALFDTLTAANILTAEAGVFIGLLTLALWVFKLTVSVFWVGMFGEIAKAVTDGVIGVLGRWGLVALTLPIGVFLGARAIHRGEHGRGQTKIAMAFLMPILAATVFSDPAGMMYGPHGLLLFGRAMGFSAAEAATHHGSAISGGGFNGQIDTLSSSLITHVMREPLEVFNFGHVVDQVGGCGAAYSQALRDTMFDGGVKAMQRCGDIAAVRYAEDLDGTNVVSGLILIIVALLFGWFMVSSGASVFKTSVAALYTVAKLVPAMASGGATASTQEHAHSTLWRYFKHPVEAMVYITFVSVMGLGVERMVSRPLPPELGGSDPFAHVVMTAAAAMTALYLLHMIRADLEGRHPGRGMLGRAGDVALGLGMHAAIGGAGSAAVGGVQGLKKKLGGGKTPWERDDESGTTPEKILGEPVAGVDPVPGPSEPVGALQPASAADPISGTAGGESTSAIGGPAPGVGPDLVSGPASRAGAAVKQAARSGRPQRTPAQRGPAQSASSAGQLTLGGAEDDALTWAPSEVAPLSASSDRDHGSYTDHPGTDIPLPPEPLDDSAVPPPDDDADSTSVDAIGGH